MTDKAKWTMERVLEIAEKHGRENSELRAEIKRLRAALEEADTGSQGTEPGTHDYSRLPR